jgi:ectoine hydroxylase-related dioxygenase (phytanoyl-CoA dioxygenase family)
MSQELRTQNHTLSQQEKDFLDENGYLVLGQLLSASQLNAIRKRLQDLMETEAEQAGSELLDSKHIRHPKEEGVDRLADLVNKGAEFDIFYTHPRLLAAISHVLGADFKLSALNYRASLKGHGLQKLHVDWHEAVPPGAYKVCNSIWLLDDFKKENGATRLVPGTHKSGIEPQVELDDPYATHPDEILLEAPAGTVVIFNSHVWHGGTVNQTEKPRRAIHSYFCLRDQPQQVHQKRYIRQETMDRIDEATRRLLDV